MYLCISTGVFLSVCQSIGLSHLSYFSLNLIKLSFTGCSKNLTSFRRPIILAIFIEMTSNVHSLYRNLPERWIGHGGEEHNFLLKSPPRSLDLTPCDFFPLGICERTCLCAPSAYVKELKQRITAALENPTQDMLQHVWHEFDYRLDVCRVTGGTHIKHL